ncbi:MAP3K12-binding inhibitory protein 1 isoform X2 [Syngnathoides biaculeatus]|uniref:MAP3K12-binding inhibitory protein 1 isoform X2 n=1 Tax=Syngnathoides biaculeatus TaxID=300417 RepID=UPI002ADDB1F6|nr:MAP3K12-binding inhibitory protein 1 isoform X2 [Syngnathoides biaculeatus]
MTDSMKTSGENSPTTESDPNKMCSYSGCMSVLLRLLADLGRELKIGDGALRVDVNIDAISPHLSDAANAHDCLQRHITKLQAVSESLKTLAEAPSRASPESTKDAPRDAASSSGLRHPTWTPPLPDDVLVQIRAGKSEIERRISAFMARKQMEINENNVREFCNVIDCNQEDSCARTDAVFTPYPGFKSHVKVTRVVNTYGPQTRAGGHGEAGDPAARDCGNTAIEERLNNIESHLKLPTAGPVPVSVYQRLKKLEDRILQLEGLSPEYFQSTKRREKKMASRSLLRRGGSGAMSPAVLRGQNS